MAVFVGWTVLSGTDGVDGWLSRRRGSTRSGAFLDPLADKVLVLGGLAMLAAQGVFPWAAVLLIAAREIAILAWRARGSRRGISVPARPLGKRKALCQFVAVGAALCPATATQPGIALGVLWLAVALTLASGLDLIGHGRRERNDGTDEDDDVSAGTPVPRSSSPCLWSSRR